MEYTIDEMKKLICVIDDDLQSTKKSLPGTMNIIELMNRHHLENQHSNVLAYLIDPDESHKHYEYGNSFIAMLNRKLEENNQPKIDFEINNWDEIKYVHKEEMTSENRRIDILIKTETSFIIIENKINARDRSEQMISYINEIEGRNDEGDKERQIFCIYLTLHKREISADSLRKDEKQRYGYLNLTYSDVLEWLNSLQTRDDEEVLRAAIIQYKDVLEGLLGKRVFFDEKKWITQKTLDYFFGKNEPLDLQSLMNILKECKNDKKEFENVFLEISLPLVIYTQFILDVRKRILASDDIQKRNGVEITNYDDFKLFCAEESYENEKDWIEAVKTEQKEFGIRWQSPNPDVTMYFMFANAWRTSAWTGYEFKKPILHEHYYLYTPKTDRGNFTIKSDKFINDHLLQISPFNGDLVKTVAENYFIKPIKAMKGKW